MLLGDVVDIDNICLKSQQNTDLNFLALTAFLHLICLTVFHTQENPLKTKKILKNVGEKWSRLCQLGFMEAIDVLQWTTILQESLSQSIYI